MWYKTVKGQGPLTSKNARYWLYRNIRVVPVETPNTITSNKFVPLKKD